MGASRLGCVCKGSPAWEWWYFAVWLGESLLPSWTLLETLPHQHSSPARNSRHGRSWPFLLALTTSRTKMSISPGVCSPGGEPGCMQRVRGPSWEEPRYIAWLHLHGIFMGPAWPDHQGGYWLHGRVLVTSPL